MTITELVIKFAIDAGPSHSGAAEVNRAQKTIEDQSAATTGKMSKHFDDAGNHVSKLGGLMQGVTMGMGIGLFNVAEQELGKLTSFVTDSSAAYRDAQTSQAQFTTALVDQHIPAVAATNAAMQTYLDQNMKLGFSADEQRSSLALLVGQTKDLGKAETELSAAEDLARLKGMPLASASLAIEKAMLGSTGGLKRYGIEVAKGSTATQILADVEKVAGNQADAYAAGPAGRLAAAHEKIHEVMVKVGAITDQVTTAVMPALAAVLGTVVDAAGPVLSAIGDAMPGAIATVEGALGTLGADLSPIVSFIGKALPGAIRAAQTGFGDMVSAVGSVSAAIAPLVNDVMVPLQQTFADITSNQDALQGALIVLGTIVATVLVPPMILLAASTIATVAPFLLAGAAIAGLLVVLDKTGVLTWLGKNVVPMLGQAFQWLQKNVIPPLTDAFTWIVKNVVPALGTAFSWVVQNVIPPLVAAFQTVAGFITGTLAPAVSHVVATVWPPLQGLFHTFTTDVLPKIVAGFKGLTDFWTNTLAPIIKNVIDVVWPPLAKVIDIMTNVLLKELEVEWGLFAGAVQTAVDLAMKILGPFVDLVDNAVTALNRLTGNNGTGAFSETLGGIGAFGSGGQLNAGGKIKAFGSGGTVDGPPGVPQLIIAHGGETITQPGKSGGDTHYHVNVQGLIRAEKPSDISREMRRMGSLGWSAGTPNPAPRVV
jgi:hypothetical protein